MSDIGLLEINDGIADSPRFRAKVRSFEGYTQSLENAVQGLSRASKALHGSSLDYHDKFSDVIQRVSGIAKLSPMETSEADQTLAEYSNVLAEIERNRVMQSEQLQQILVQPMLDELESGGGLVGKVKTAKRRVDGLQTEFESQLARLMGRKASEPLLARQEQDVDAAKSQYISQQQLLSLDYNRLASLKKVEFLESFLSLMYAQYAFYHQAFSSLRDFEPTMRKLGEHIAQLRHQSQDRIDEAAAQVISPSPRANEGSAGSSLDDSGYMQVGQMDNDDYVQHQVHSMDHDSAETSVKNVAQRSPALAHRRTLSQKRRSLASISLSPHGQFQISGYLFLRSQYSLMASWQRRWFEIRDGSLVHFQRGDESDKESVPLHLCMVKRSNSSGQDRRHVFELIAPNRTYTLQAESADELSAWKACLKQAIEASLYSHNPAATPPAPLARTASQPLSTPPSPIATGRTDPRTALGGKLSSVNLGAAGNSPPARDVQAQRMAKLRQPRGNGHCVDCGQASPEWAAINVGVLLCIECSGIHRSLGVHVSKVRSVKLDNWEPELMQIMQRLGNARVNRIFESQPPAPDDPQKPTPQSLREDKQPYLTLKYAERRFVTPPESSDDAAAALVRAAGTADLPLALQALAQGASANAHDPESGRTPLIAAVSMGDFGMLELLFLWGADVNMRAQVSATTYMSDSPRSADDSADAPTPARTDGFGGTALHLATRLGNVRMVWYLVRKGAQWDTPDAYGLLPLDIALEDSNVQVVMALRYAAFQKASGLPPGTLGSGRSQRAGGNGSGAGPGTAAEPVDMLDMDDSFIRDWAIPPYSPYIEDDGDCAESKDSDTKDSGAKDSDAKDSDTKDSDAKGSDAKDSGVKDSDAKDSSSKDSSSKDSKQDPASARASGEFAEFVGSSPVASEATP